MKYNDERLSLRKVYCESLSRNGLDIYKISHESPRKNSFKSFQSYLCLHSLFSYLLTYK